jgi:MFS family permease
VATAFSASPTMLAVTLGATGLFAAIYHPIGTAMLVDAAGDRPGRAIGINGVFGNIGVGLAPVVTAFLASQAGLTGLIYAALHGAIDLELGGRSSGSKGLGSIETTADLLFQLLRSVELSKS